MERRKFTREFNLEAVRLIKDRGVSYVQAAQELGVHQSVLRDWVKALADDPQHAFRGNGQMKPEQLEIARLRQKACWRNGELLRIGHARLPHHNRPSLQLGCDESSQCLRIEIDRVEEAFRAEAFANLGRLEDTQ